MASNSGLGKTQTYLILWSKFQWLLHIPGRRLEVQFPQMTYLQMCCISDLLFPASIPMTLPELPSILSNNTVS